MVKCKTLQRGYNMTNISEIIEEILVEWAYRVHDGMPNPKNAQHIIELRESMEELNLPNKVIYEVIQNLINEEKVYYSRSKESNRIVQYKNKDNYEKGIEDGSHEIRGIEKEIKHWWPKIDYEKTPFINYFFILKLHKK